MRETVRVCGSVAVKNAVGCLKTQAETGAANGVTCRTAETWQRFVASAPACRAVAKADSFSVAGLPFSCQLQRARLPPSSHKQLTAQSNNPTPLVQAR